MFSIAGIDLLEQELLDHERTLLEILLQDKTTKKNIIWATDDYAELGEPYSFKKEILPELVTGEQDSLIQPRVEKALEHQTNRTRDKAEVFTPSWICNAQNNLVDEQWFGRKDVFNIQKEMSWKATADKIAFPDDRQHTWQKYVDAQRLEISCGEAPYLVSRYDTVTGETIPISQRIGLLDRKLRVISENTDTEEEWFTWTKRAFQSVYGFAETHLAVPEHRVFLAEHPQRLIDAVHLLIPQGNGSLFWRSRDSLRQNADLPLTLFGSGQSRAAFLDRLNCTNGNGQRHIKPFAVLIGIGELPGRKARIVQHVMDIVIIEQFRIGRTIREGDGSACQLGILQVVFNHRRLGILVDAVTGSTIQLRTVGRKLFVAVHAVKICLSDLPVALVLGIVNRKDVNQPIRHGWFIRCHLHFLPSPSKGTSLSGWNASLL